jgi:hypothetical protein
MTSVDFASHGLGTAQNGTSLSPGLSSPRESIPERETSHARAVGDEWGQTLGFWDVAVIDVSESHTDTARGTARH